MAADKATTPNRRTVGNYDMLVKIGFGAFATVYKGRHLQDGSIVAIKDIHKARLDKKLQDNLQSEIDILKSLRHPNIVNLLDTLRTTNHTYLITEFCGGGDLANYIKENKRRDPERAVKILKQLACGLEFMHRHNFVHRDIKPQNILLAEENGEMVAKIGDFGFARTLFEDEMAATLCGSPQYMAPEILNYQKYDYKVDLWSLGCVAYELLTGVPPYTAQNHMELARLIATRPVNYPSALPEVCVHFLSRLLVANPTARATFEEFYNHPFLGMTPIDRRDGTVANVTVVVRSSPPASPTPSAATFFGTSPPPILPVAAVPIPAPAPSGPRQDQPVTVRQAVFMQVPNSAPVAPFSSSPPKIGGPLESDVPMSMVPPPMPPWTGILQGESPPQPTLLSTSPVRIFSTASTDTAGAIVRTNEPVVTIADNVRRPSVPSAVLQGSASKVGSPPIPKIKPFKDAASSSLPGDSAIVAASSAPHAVGSNSGLEREYVMVDRDFVEINSYADSIGKGRGRAAQVAELAVRLPLDRACAPFMACTGMVQGLAYQWYTAQTGTPAASAEEEEALNSLDRWGKRGSAVAELAAVFMARGAYPTAVALCVVALSCYQAALNGIKRVVPRTRDAVSQNVNLAIQLVRDRFNQVLEAAEIARESASSRELVSIEKVLYENALKMAREGGNDESLGNFQIGEVKYLKASFLLETLLTRDSLPAEDRVTVEKFISALETRVLEVRRRLPVVQQRVEQVA